MQPAHRLRYCSFCDQTRAFRKSRFRHGRHLGMTIVTAGIWSIGWLSSWVHWRFFGPERCVACRHRHRDLGGECSAETPGAQIPKPELADVRRGDARAAGWLTGGSRSSATVPAVSPTEVLSAPSAPTVPAQPGAE